MANRPQTIALKLPPFSFLQKWLARKNFLALHFLVLCVLYAALAITASIERVVLIHGGIGILQNPPFFVHLLCGVCSIPLVLIITRRVAKLSRTEEGAPIIASFLQAIRRSRLKIALFGATFSAGLLSLAYTVVLSLSYESTRINIYDSTAYPLTFSAYLAVRVYLYLICYPVVFAAAPTITYHLFRAVQNAAVRYHPFHYDGMGGLKQYFVAVDRPMYGAQSFAVLIALMNYFGWGGMKFVPMILSIAAPIIVTLLAVFLFAHFRVVLTSKKEDEIRAIRLQQMEIYLAARSLASLNGKECLELLERIEATERLIDSIKKSSFGELKKYFFNIGVLVVGQIMKPASEIIVRKFFGGGP